MANIPDTRFEKDTAVIALSTISILTAMDLIAYAMLPTEQAEILSKGMKAITDTYTKKISELLVPDLDTHD